MGYSKVVISGKDYRDYDGSLLVFYAVKNDDKTVAYDPCLKRYINTIIECEDFSAKPNETTLIYPENYSGKRTLQAARVLLVGLGKADENLDEFSQIDLFRSVGGTVSKICSSLNISEVMFGPGPTLDLELNQVAQAVSEGLVMGDYRFEKYKTKEKKENSFKGIKTIRFYATGKQQKKVREAARIGATVGDATCSARDMANEPGNGWTAAKFADHAKKLSKKFPLSCTILEKKELVKLGMGGILGVNQGSAAPPKLVILDYKPKKKSSTLLLVGKGLTFDSGGVSLKPAAGMEDMKYDMCGGAAVLAAMEAIGAEKPDVRVVAMIPATDNMPGSSAIKPGDVITHYNGITSEVINTDAEGRLILADALAYGVKKYKPDCAVDIATLTGAIIIALGHHYTGIMSNNDSLVAQLEQAGKRSGEPNWRLPLDKMFAKQLESQVADTKNIGGRPGGSITAAAYLEKFIGDTPWAHMDIAGTAWNFTEKTYIPKGPSGVGVRTLVEFVRNWSEIK